MTDGRTIVELTEWGHCIRSDLHLAPEDHKIAAELSGQRRLIVEELRAGLRIEARSWVGLVRFQAFEIRISPKAAGGNQGIVRMVESTSGLESFKRLSSRRLITAEGSSLLDLIALLFVEATELVIRQGLLRDYVEREDLLVAARGRLLLDKQALSRFGQIDRLACLFDEHEQDIIENRLLAFAMGICALITSDLQVKRSARRLSAILREVCDPIAMDLGEARALVYHRMNSHYREAHELSWLLLLGLGIEDVLAPGTTGSFAFLLNMNLLFERFVRALFDSALRGSDVKVDYQHKNRMSIWNLDSNRSFMSVIPDLLLTPRASSQRGIGLPIDAKYKLYDEHEVTSSDIYQAFMYSYAFGGEGLPSRAKIVYPASLGSVRTRRLAVRGVSGVDAAELELIGIPIVEALDELTSPDTGSVMTTLRNAASTGVPVPAPTSRLDLGYSRGEPTTARPAAR